MEELIKLLYVYGTDFIINVANLFHASYYEINFILFIILFPIAVLSCILFYCIAFYRLKSLQKSMKKKTPKKIMP